MRTAKLVLGILSLILFIIIMLQSCAVGVVNSIDENSSDLSGGAGTLLAFVMLVAGIIGVVARDSKRGSMTAGILYAAGALIGFAGHGTYGDLAIWSVVALVFGVVFILSSLRMPGARPAARGDARRYDSPRYDSQRYDSPRYESQRYDSRQYDSRRDSASRGGGREPARPPERRPSQRYGTMQRSRRR